MRHVDVIGIGPGDPDMVTVQAVQALRAADAFLLVRKGHHVAALEDARAAVLDRHVGGDWRERLLDVVDPERGRGAEAVAAWRAERRRRVDAALATTAPDATVAILAWGDPALYDATLGVLAGLEVTVRVVAGISAPSALAAAHGITLNRVGGSVAITTGRRVRDHGLPDADDVVVMLDPDAVFADLEEDGAELFWGAYLGSPDELLVAGPLHEAGPRAKAVRDEARERHGWLFDTYLVRRAAR